MTILRWDQLTSTPEGYTLDLKEGEEVVATLVHTKHGDSLTVRDQTWRLGGSPDSGLSASLPDGRVFTAVGKNKKIGRALVIDGDFSGTPYRFVNETRSDWIIDNAQDKKVAQFTGASHGVRHTELEVEDGVVFPAEHAIFAAYVARAALEGKMLSMTLVFTICLALLAPFTLLVLYFS